MGNGICKEMEDGFNTESGYTTKGGYNTRGGYNTIMATRDG